MAWSAAALTSDETAWAAADKPILAASVIPVSPTTAKWTEVGTTTATDRTLATAPARYAFDGWGHLRTTPDTTASSTWYLVFDLGASYVIDSWGYYGHNLGSLGVNAVSLQIADNGAFSTNLQTLASGAPPATNGRFLGLDLHHTGSVPLCYSGVRYVRVKLEDSSNFTPSIGELWLLRRRQLQFQPDRPFDGSSVKTDAEGQRTYGGVGMSIRRNGGRAYMAASWDIVGATQQQDIRDWHGQLNDGVRPFIWCRKPASAPQSFHVMRLSDPSLDFPEEQQAPTACRLEIEAEEQGPENYYLKKAVY